jgi:hypothetical protein
MKTRIAAFLPIFLIVLLPIQHLQAQTGEGAAVQQRGAELKQSIAANRAKLMKYQWLQSTQVNVKGETKKEEENMCHYGPDGQVVKTPVGPPPEEKNPPRGLKGKIVEKKVGEMEDYIQRLKSLISHYTPPDPEKLQAAMQAGNGSMNAAEGIVTLTFTNYYKPGDKVAFGFDTAGKKLRSYDVNTYLDDPVKDTVTLTNQFASLPDGTNHVQQTVLNAKEKQIQVTTTNSDFTPLTQ